MYGRSRSAIALLEKAARAVLTSAHPTSVNWNGCSLESGLQFIGSGANLPKLMLPPLAAGWPLSQQVAEFASKAGAKHGKAGRKGGKASGGEEDEQTSAGPPQEFDMAPFTTQMTKAVEHLSRELAGIRTGRAAPGLLENVLVAAASRGGQHVPLRTLGTVVARNPQLLVVEVYDPQDAQSVSDAIEQSALKLQARVEQSEVLVTVPRLTMDMLERMIKLAGQEAEAVRQEVRRARHAALAFTKKLKEAGGVSDDVHRRRETEVQTATDRFIRQIDDMLKAKEKDLREKH